jgi:hypothetical protein
MQSKLGHEVDVPNDDTLSATARDEDMESEHTDVSPMNPPTHLQQLFDNEFVDTQSSAALATTASSDRVSNTLVTKARSRLRKSNGDEISSNVAS